MGDGLPPAVVLSQILPGVERVSWLKAYMARTETTPLLSSTENTPKETYSGKVQFDTLPSKMLCEVGTASRPKVQ